MQARGTIHPPPPNTHTPIIIEYNATDKNYFSNTLTKTKVAGLRDCLGQRRIQDWSEGGGGGGVQKLQMSSDGGNKGIENRQMYKMSKSRIEDATKYQSVD